MDFNKISEHHILHIVMAVAALIVAVAVRFICVNSGCDAGTANLVFIITLSIEVVVYLILMKAITNQVDKFISHRNSKKIEKESPVENFAPAEESIHYQIVREKFEQAITIFLEYTQKAFGRYIGADELEKLNSYVELFAREQPIENINPIPTPSRQLSNNDLYHYGWNLWNHFKSYREDQRQDCVVSWLKMVFANLNEVEFSTIKGKLTIFDSKSKISIQKNIPDYLRFLKE